MQNTKNQEYYAYKEITENPIILDFSNCKNLTDIHFVFKQKFGLPEYYGENPDALWDLLDGLFIGLGEITAKIYGFNSLNPDLQKNCKVLFEVLDDVQSESENFNYEIID